MYIIYLLTLLWWTGLTKNEKDGMEASTITKQRQRIALVFLQVRKTWFSASFLIIPWKYFKRIPIFFHPFTHPLLNQFQTFAEAHELICNTTNNSHCKMRIIATILTDKKWRIRVGTQFLQDESPADERWQGVVKTFTILTPNWAFFSFYLELYTFYSGMSPWQQLYLWPCLWARQLHLSVLGGEWWTHL